MPTSCWVLALWTFHYGRIRIRSSWNESSATELFRWKVKHLMPSSLCRNSLRCFDVLSAFISKKKKLPYSHFSDRFYLISCSNFSWTFIARVQIGSYHKTDHLNASAASFLWFWGFASRHWQNGGCSTRLRPAGRVTIWDGDKWRESEQAEWGWPTSCYHPLHYSSSRGSPFSPPPC